MMLDPEKKWSRACRKLLHSAFGADSLSFTIRLVLTLFFAAVLVGSFSSAVASEPSAVFIRRVELFSPPFGWMALFYYADDTGLIQKGLEREDRIRLYETQASGLWNKIRDAVPSDSLSVAVIPHELPSPGVDMDPGASLQVWVRYGDDDWRGWAGQASLAKEPLQVFCASLRDGLRDLPFNDVPGQMERTSFAGFLRAEVLDRTTAAQLEKDGLFIDLTRNSGGTEFQAALARPFRTMPVAEGRDPFPTGSGELVFGRTVVEGRLDALRVQGRSWRLDTEP